MISTQQFCLYEKFTLGFDSVLMYGDLYEGLGVQHVPLT